MRKYETLNCKRDFLALKREKGFFTHLFSLRVKKNNYGYHRLGVIVSKKLGNAVFRNKCKRRVKEAVTYNLNIHKIQPHNLSENLHSTKNIDCVYDIVIMPKKELATCEFKQLLSTMQNSFIKTMKMKYYTK